MIYLVDLENVGMGVFEDIDSLKKSDSVYAFYTNAVKNANMKLNTHIKMINTAAKLVFFDSACGTKNALDFQLASYLGFILRDNIKEDITIISNDKGYDCLIHFWQSQNLSRAIISRKSNFRKETTQPEQPVQPTQPAQDTQSKKRLKEKELKDIIRQKFPEANKDRITRLYIAVSRSTSKKGLTRRVKGFVKANEVQETVDKLQAYI